MDGRQVVYLIPSDLMDNSQKTWRTRLNRLSEKARRGEKIYIIDTESLKTAERDEIILETARAYQKEGYTVLVAAAAVEEVDVMLRHKFETLVFERGTDLFLMMTCLRALYRDEFDTLIKLYEMHTGSRFKGVIPKPGDEKSHRQFLKNLVFFIPKARKYEYSEELYRSRKKIEKFILSA